MTSRPATPRPAASRPAPSRRSLALAWLLTAAVVGAVGALLRALAEEPADRALGLTQVVAAVLALAAAAAVLLSPERAGPWSRALSGALVLLGVVTAVVLIADEPVFVGDVLLLSLPSLLGGVLTALVGAGRLMGAGRPAPR